MAEALQDGGRRGDWQDWLTLTLGAWLFVSPWVLGYAGTPAAAWNAWAAGACLVLAAWWALARAAAAAEGVILAFAAWLVVSPWILGFAAAKPPVYWNAALIGLATGGLAVWDLLTRRGLS